MNLAKKHEECSFFAMVSPEQISDEFCEKVCPLQNIALSIGIEADPEKAAIFRKAFDSLFQKHCIYGFHTYYSAQTVERILTEGFLSFVLKKHCIFGIYINEDEHETETEDLVFRFVSRIRGSNGRPLIAIDWYKDNLFISNSISPGSDYMTIDAKENLFFHEKRICLRIKQPNLREMIGEAMPAI
ncbi:hypothetical protein SDC9_183459 [bioreactor metagenome]|uniref:Uncharacterized protein n=1 Tax=bioreactor metagenome TaxID=1076179 RepID=A0A645HIK5_9ZZZZ